MDELLRERILRRLENLPNDKAYQVLDYIEFLESKFASRSGPSTLEKIADRVEDTLRAGRVSPSRMFKAFPAEGGIRSPLLIKLPGEMANAGSMNHSFLHVRDMMPTILELTGIEQPAPHFNGRPVRPIQGSSVLEMLEGKVASPRAEVSHVGYELFGMKAFFADRWKILWMPKPFGTGDWELFNLEHDPAELNDLSNQYPDKLEELVAQWEQYKKDNGVLDVSFDLSDSIK